ncbi:MAG: hypothetical protein EBV06_03485 [Planctomycetia bacterium]|nr:hypothetical protein [Planctomycetia bacterium]
MLLSEDDWFTRPDPGDLLRHLEKTASLRKLRLFACHCCRRLGPLVGAAGVREALLTAERFADGKANSDELRTGWRAIRQALAKAPLGTRWERALDAALHACSPDLTFWDAVNVSREAAHALEGDSRPQDSGSFGVGPYVRPREYTYQCVILRELFSYHTVEISSHLRAWEDGQLARLAQAIYLEQRFDEMPILADALEEAGCTHRSLIDHARETTPHFKGCWLLDALMAN